MSPQDLFQNTYLTHTYMLVLDRQLGVVLSQRLRSDHLQNIEAAHVAMNTYSYIDIFTHIFPGRYTWQTHSSPLRIHLLLDRKGRSTVWRRFEGLQRFLIPPVPGVGVFLTILGNQSSQVDRRPSLSTVDLSSFLTILHPLTLPLGAVLWYFPCEDIIFLTLSPSALWRNDFSPSLRISTRLRSGTSVDHSQPAWVISSWLWSDSFRLNEM